MLRPRLSDRIGRGARGQLTCLTAPVGYGKTTLIEQWAAEHHERPMLWIDLPSTLHRFSPRPSRLLTHLQTGPEVVLVLDGLDVLGWPPLGDDLAELIVEGHRDMFLLVARRSRGPAALDALLARGEGTEIDAAELSFTAAEAAEAIREVSDRELDERQIGRLIERTEGWPAGVALAAMAVDRAEDVDAVLEGFGGEDRHVAALLTDHVLTHLPERQRRFLVCTSVLERLDGPACQALTGERAANAMLRGLAREVAFIRRADGWEGTFVVHPLLRELLRRELRLSAPGAEADALERAAGWHIEHGELEEAARCLRDADRPDLLLELVDRYGGQMFEAGDVRGVLQWLDTIREEDGEHANELSLRRAYLSTMLGETPRAEQLIHGLPRRELTAGQRAVADALQATWIFFDAPPETVIPAADEVLAALPRLDPSEIPDVFGLTSPIDVWAMACGSPARALWHLGEVSEARRAFVVVANHDDVYPPWRTHVVSSLALLEAWSGNLHAAIHLASRAMTMAAGAMLSHHPATLDARLARAMILTERGDLRRAEHALAGAHAIAARTRRPATTMIHACELALWHHAAGSPEQGLAVIQESRAQGVTPPPFVEQHLDAAESRLLLATDQASQARRLLDRVGDPVPEPLRSVEVQSLLAVQDLDAAREAVGAWSVDRAENRARLDRELWQAVVEFEGGARRAAVRSGLSLAARARADGRLRLFLDAGPQADHLLRAVSREAGARFPTAMLRTDATTPNRTAGLSDREREVVRYLPTTLSSAEIARELYISLNTLKTHLHSIYAKLGVHGRGEAIERAKQLGIA